MPQPIERRPNVDVLALFALEADGSRIRAFLGTGFLLADGILVTCWHCVRDAVKAGNLVAAVESGAEPVTSHILRDIAQDPNGADIATAKVDRIQLFGLTLAAARADIGADVWTYGYPLTDPPNERRQSWQLNARYLEGYVTRVFYFSDQRIPSYELDMRAPAGVSGAPLIAVGTKQVIGVVYGAHQTETTEIIGTIDPATGRRDPEVVRIEQFALAHDTVTLREVRGPATGGRPLGEAVEAAEVAAEREFKESEILGPARRASDEDA